MTKILFIIFIFITNMSKSKRSSWMIYQALLECFSQEFLSLACPRDKKTIEVMPIIPDGHYIQAYIPRCVV
ncbi:MAG: hypothetical protein B9J98_03255 [Candidatus Terraquivivens tikiterensis]|uniref:Uncharacterized protein n=1 Tax=Candidatus Terraquivivens tikiterensis TaxID=1980982 RepID=A0A2R7Y6D6_9ARCH|nr:MAG: hypothetical protein B9J98_03255 [Candidatus Terraquivivens tikiterensis]